MDLTQWVASTETPTLEATGTEVDAVSVPYPDTIETITGDRKPTFFRVVVSETP